MKRIVFAVALAFVAACKGSEPPASRASLTHDKDRIVVLATHHVPKPTDPVVVRFDRFRVVKASFDPKTIEGGTATVEIDLASLATGSSERDEHLKSDAYINASTFAAATVAVANVKQQADKKFTADATVTFHGATKTYPVTFEVLGQTPDAIRIKAEHTFSRLDFGVGTDPAQDPEQQVGTSLTIQMELTLDRS